MSERAIGCCQSCDAYQVASVEMQKVLAAQREKIDDFNAVTIGHQSLIKTLYKRLDDRLVEIKTLYKRLDDRLVELDQTKALLNAEWLLRSRQDHRVDALLASLVLQYEAARKLQEALVQVAPYGTQVTP